jgi:hypothetical protein
VYPHDELTRLAAHKATLRADIARSRAQCAQAAARLAQPLEWVDRVRAFGLRWLPLARLTAVPLGFVFQRLLFRRSKLLGPVVRWGPLVAGVIGRIGSHVMARRPASTPTPAPADPRRDEAATPNRYRPDGD